MPGVETRCDFALGKMTVVIASAQLWAVRGCGLCNADARIGKTCWLRRKKLPASTSDKLHTSSRNRLHVSLIVCTLQARNISCYFPHRFG